MFPHDDPSRPCRIGLRAPALALALVGLLGATPAPAAEPGYASWFRYDPEVTQRWEFAAVEGDPLQVSIHPKDAVGPVRRVFVLYPRASSAYDIAISKILAAFDQKGMNAEFRVVNFDRDDGRGAAALQAVAAGGYELIFSMGSESTAWLHERYRGGAIPVVSVCSKDPVMLGQATDYNSGTGTNFALTSLNMPIEVQLAYLLDFRPGLKNLGILVDGRNVSAVQTQAEPMARLARERDIQVLEVTVQEPEHAREELEPLVRDAVARMRQTDPTLSKSVFWITGSTAVFREIKTINDNAGHVPVLSVAPEIVRAGDDSAVMAIGISFESNAHLAAIYGADILSGRVRAGDLKVGVVSPPDIAINFRRARDIGLEIPFSFFESASVVYDFDGRMVRNSGRALLSTN